MKILLLILFFSVQLQAQPFLLMGKTPVVASSYQADTLRVNFSEASHAYAGFVNMTGDPKAGVVTYTHTNGWTVSTISTSNWAQYTNGKCVLDGFTGAGSANNFFTGYSAALLSNGFFMYDAAGNYNASFPQIRISGLNPSLDYKIRYTGCRGSMGFDANPMEYRVSGATSPSMQSVNGSVTSQSAGGDFTLKPNGSGQINVWLNTQAANSILAVIAAMEIIQLVP
ncbi:MAG: hypothetical protein ACTHMV_13635 [Chitinophagaceae bacterium]